MALMEVIVVFAVVFRNPALILTVTGDFMKYALPFVFASILAGASHAQTTAEPEAPPMIRPVESSDLSEFLWIKRPIIIFADTPADPRYAEQIEYLTRGMDELEARDVVVLTDTDPANPSPLRKKLRPRGFMLVLVGKDGGIKLRKPFAWDVREISRSIDKMPMRQREIRENKVNSGR
jgi:hypothetical protein